MKRLVLYGVLVVLTISLSAQKLEIGGTDVVKPFSGMVVNVLKDAGFTANISMYPTPRLVQGLGDGSIDGGFFFGDAFVASIKGAVKIPVVLFKNELVAVSVRPEVKITSNADLAKYKIGTVRGNAIHEAITKGLNPTLTDNEESEFKMLAANRFDVAIAPKLTAAFKKGVDSGQWIKDLLAIMATLNY